MKYFLSVIVPVYNCEKYLPRAVESVTAQSVFERVELILVDDGSTDNSGKICDKYAQKYENITAFHQSNSGVSVARNRGMELASADRISFLDSDDYFLPDAFECIENHSADMVCFDFTCGDGGCIGKMIDFDYAKKSEFKNTLYPAMALSDAFFNCWNKIYKKEIIEKNNIRFEPDMKYGEDMKFVYEYVKAMDTFEFIRQPLYCYDVNEGSATMNIPDEYGVYKLLYLWLTRYFSSVDCEHEKCQRMIESNFVYKSWTAVSSAGKLDFFDCAGRLKRIINDELFTSLYEKEGYGNFQSRYDKLVDRFIKKKNAVLLTAVVKAKR